MQSRALISRKGDKPASSILAAWIQKWYLPPAPHPRGKVGLDIRIMRRQDAVRIRRQFRAYTGPIDDFKINDLVYAAVLPPVRNTKKLHISWSGPLQITEIINQAMVRIKELNVHKPRLYDARISKLRLANIYSAKICYSWPTNYLKLICLLR